MLNILCAAWGALLVVIALRGLAPAATRPIQAGRVPGKQREGLPETAKR
jgi:hypothetical protein